MIRPTVITSKAASKDYNRIVAAHADLLTGMANHSVKVANYNTQKQTELANKNAMQAEMQKETMASNTQAAKDSQEFALRQGELDIKRAALSQV